jgi:hypothetical protein
MSVRGSTDSISRMLAELKARDPLSPVFGACAHRYLEHDFPTVIEFSFDRGGLGV